MTKRHARGFALAALAFLAVGAAGCASTSSSSMQEYLSASPRETAGFGNAVRANVAKQTLNPEASRNADPVTGIDARSAANAYDRYQQSFKVPPPPLQVFGIGGLGQGTAQ
jgi:type IV pilus biogenesis protein CpaD/CtpE